MAKKLKVDPSAEQHVYNLKELKSIIIINLMYTSRVTYKMIQAMDSLHTSFDALKLTQN